MGAWLILALACSRSRDRQTAPASQPFGRALVASSSTAHEVTPTGVPTPPASASARPLRTRYEPGTVVCGSRLCRVASEGCCQNADEHACAPLAKIPGAPRSFHGLERWPDCSAAKFSYEVSEVSLCDDSSDCLNGEMCCSMWLTSGAHSAWCTPGKPGGVNVCDYFERCVEGQACRTKQTECVDGRCELTEGTLRCGNATCLAPAQVCCRVGGRLACATEAQCDVPADWLPTIYHCTGPSACPAGAHCAEALFGARCQGLLDVAATTIMCEADGDCPHELCETMREDGPPRCVPRKDGWRVCRCQRIRQPTAR